MDLGATSLAKTVTATDLAATTGRLSPAMSGTGRVTPSPGGAATAAESEVESTVSDPVLDTRPLAAKMRRLAARLRKEL